MRRNEGEIWLGNDSKVRKYSRGVTFVFLQCDTCGEEGFYTESSLAGGVNRCLDCKHSMSEGCNNGVCAEPASEGRYNGCPISNDYPITPMLVKPHL